MTAQNSVREIADRTPTTDEATSAAKRRVYDAETALHAARQSGVDAWVAAAYDRLHAALVAYEALLTAWIAGARAA